MSDRQREAERLAALHALQVLDTAPEPAFDALVRVASMVCRVPISLISLVDAQRQWFKANLGLEGVDETPRAFAFCAHAIDGDDLLEVPDAGLDPRFADNPLVVGRPDIRFYAGAPLTLGNGQRLGTLCVIDRQPRQLDAHQREVLRLLAQAAVQLLEGRLAIRQGGQAARALAHREQELRQMVDRVPAMLAYWNRDLTCRFANQAYERWFGIQPQALVGCHVDTLPDAAPHAPSRHHLEAALRGEPQVFERTLTGPDGLPRHSLAHYMPDVVDGQVAGLVVQVSDVSALKAAEAALRQSQDFLERTGRVAGVGGWELDLRSGALLWSSAVCRIHGVETDWQPTLDEALAFYTPASRPRIEAAVAVARAGGPGFDLELEIVRRDGQTRAVRAVGSVDSLHGSPLRLSGALQDVTEQRHLAAALARQHELLRVTLQSIGEAVITTDDSGRVTWLNPEAERLTGWTAAQAQGRLAAQVFHLVHEETRAPLEHPVATCLAHGKAAGPAQHTLLISRQGAELGVEHSAARIRSESGETLGVVLVFHDVSEQRRVSGEMTYRATHDALTGLINRPEFEARLLRLLRQAHDDHTEHALLYIDLDHFKAVNDACGHAVGDRLLQQVARLLAEAVRARDTIARLGGDEFAILLEHCPAAQAQRVAQKICDRMDDFRFIHEDRRFRIGTSIGLVPVDRRWVACAALQQAADTACYAAKEAGRNRVHAWFDSDLEQRSRSFEGQWSTRLERALAGEGFMLFGQRIAPLSPQAAGPAIEVLLRLRQDGGDVISPAAFLPPAERFHLISRIDRWVLERTLSWLQAAPAAAIDTVCINLSGASIGDRAFHAWAEETLAEAGPVLRSRLCLEIGESAAVTNLADASIFIDRMRAAGVRVALDDFGTGSTSFGYLKALPVDYLKIDGRFSRDLLADPLDDAAVRCFVDVARVVGVRTVAECVEQPAVLQRLRELGVDLAQGHAIHRPEPLEALLAGQRRSLQDIGA